MTTTTTPTTTTPDVCIKTYTGIYFDLIEPHPIEVDLVDIAHSLSLINRFNGHTPQPYSVAEHCLLVSARVERLTNDTDLALAGLLHDAPEAYIGDMTGLLKRSGVGDKFRVVEDVIARTIEECFQIEPFILDAPAVKIVDREAFEWECSFVRDSRVRVAPEPRDVELAYIARFHDLI